MKGGFWGERGVLKNLGVGEEKVGEKMF